MEKHLMRKIAAILLITVLIVTSVPVFSAERQTASAVQPLVKAGLEYGENRINDLAVTMGKDESRYNLTWTSYHEGDEEIRWIDCDQLNDASFPDQYNVITAKKETSVSARGYVCRAELTGLASEKSYSYRIGSASTGWSQAYTLSTSKFDDGAFSFLFAGDPQIGASTISADQAGWKTTLDKANEWFGDDIEFILSAGDEVNDHWVEDQYRNSYVPQTLNSLPIMTCVGNHDNGFGYSEHFTYTDVDPATAADAGEYAGDYWVAYDGALILCLNTNELSVSLHRAFMEKAIAEYTDEYGDPNWKLVTFHHSFYSAASGRYNESYFREPMSLLFSELGIDAVLTGHDHIHTRTYMMDGYTPVDDASRYTAVGDDLYGSFVDPDEGMVFYLTANSSSGSKHYDLATEKIPYVAFSNQENVPNITKVDVTADSILFTTYRTDGNNDIGDVLDSFAIHRTVEEDVYAPVLNVPSYTSFYINDDIDLLDGITAYDNVDKDLTSKITISGNLSLTEESTLIYSVTDSAGNTTSAERTFSPFNGIEPVTAETTVWKYLDDGSNPTDDEDAPHWSLAEFDDSAWNEGKSSFGFRNGELGTHGNMTSKTLLRQKNPPGHDDEGFNIPNYFFRTTFDIDDPERVLWITGDIWYDDGVEVYINGVLVQGFNAETARNHRGFLGNSSVGDAAYGKLSITDKETISSLNLKETGNILAVQLYQVAEESDDIFFHFGSMLVGLELEEFPFEDIAENAWYYTAVTRAYYKDLFVGTSDTLFSPDATMTRAMVWTVLARISGADITSDGGPWYKGAQDWAVQSGVSDGTYPDDNITRQQLVAMLYRLKGNPASEGSIDSFADKDQVADWAKDAMIWAVTQGLMKGRTEDALVPEGNATRAEACTLILKYLNNQ